MSSDPSTTNIGLVVKAQRKKIGLTQHQLAGLAGLSRATLAALETGRAEELGLGKLQRLLHAIGLSLDVGQRKPRHSGSMVDRVLAAANRDQRNVMDPDRLLLGLTTGVQLIDWGHHLQVVLALDIDLLQDLVVELSQTSEVDSGTLWSNMRKLASKLDVVGPYWPAQKG